MIKTTYEDTCVLHNTDRNENIEAEVLEYRPGTLLSVSIRRQIKMTLLYNQRGKVYVGSMAGYEFTTPGPKERTVYQGRGR